MNLLRVMTPEAVSRLSKPVFSLEVEEHARRIVDDVREVGVNAIRSYAVQFGERTSDEPLVLTPVHMQEAYESLDSADRAVLHRVADRIKRFADSQRDSIKPLTLEVPGGQAGHSIEPVHSAGCYAPAGRYPLPSSVLMTAITARSAGCRRVVVASPGANRTMLAAAHIAGADEFLSIGGAHAIGAMAYGFEGFDRCDVIAGPGNAWVTAAKKIVSGDVGIDMLAGPSELLVIADETANAAVVAADLLAQAEHDTEAVPMLITPSQALANQVEYELVKQLETLQTADTAREALSNGFVVLCENIDQAVETANSLAPEHLQINAIDASGIATRIRNAGAIFIGENTPEVIGDYGIGPNHTLPTGGTARFQAGLSVIDFLRLRTWINLDDSVEAAAVFEDTKRLAEMEGLAGHKNAVLARECTTA